MEVFIWFFGPYLPSPFLDVLAVFMFFSLHGITQPSHPSVVEVQGDTPTWKSTSPCVCHAQISGPNQLQWSLRASKPDLMLMLLVVELSWSSAGNQLQIR